MRRYPTNYIKTSYIVQFLASGARDAPMVPKWGLDRHGRLPQRSGHVAPAHTTPRRTAGAAANPDPRLRYELHHAPESGGLGAARGSIGALQGSALLDR